MEPLHIFWEGVRLKKTLFRTFLLIILIAALAASAWCIWYIVQYYGGSSFKDDLREIGLNEPAPIDVEQESIEIPVNFPALRQTNPDIYGWIEIPDTGISYAMLRREGDNDYYMNHAENGSYYSGGCVFSDDVNSPEMTDTVTILYGHNLRNGTMFAKLNDFADSGVFSNHRYIYVYLPDRALVYEIFSAAPHSNEQILKEHDFSDREEYEAFFADVANVSGAAQRREDCFPTFDERVLILSTCFRGNNQNRMLVMGRLIAEIPAA